MSESTLLDSIEALALENPNVLALWLYGSMARQDNHENSDYDLAVIFRDHISNKLDRRLRPELLSLEWQSALTLPEHSLSIVDLSACPPPLGWSILSEGRLLVDKDAGQRMITESRIFSMWEIDYLARHQDIA